MNESVEVAIVGAGPYGLSLAAHLDSAGIQTRVFGRPMDSWRSHMPEGMWLKSDPFASNLSDPQDFYTLAHFSKEQSIPYSEAEPVKLDVFCNYGLNFQKRWAPRLTEAYVTKIERRGDEFIIALDNGGKASAHRVVIATGVGPFQYVPEILGALPGEFVSHSFDHHNLSGFSGVRVAVVGGGASAIDLAGLLHERGCDVTLITRRTELRFTGGSGPPPSGPASLLRRMRHPPSGLGPGLRSRFSTDAPLLIHALPKRLRFEFVRRHLGPAASKMMKDKVVGRVPLLLERELAAAAVEDSRVALTLRRKDGHDVLRVDHVIAATGFRVDLNRMTILSPSLRKEITAYRGAPILTWNFESSAHGLYFIGLAAAASFGPLMRFTFGARYAARRLTRALVRSRRASAKSFVGSTLDGHAETSV